MLLNLTSCGLHPFFIFLNGARYSYWSPTKFKFGPESPTLGGKVLVNNDNSVPWRFKPDIS